MWNIGWFLHYAVVVEEVEVEVELDVEVDVEVDVEELLVEVDVEVELDVDVLVDVLVEVDDELVVVHVNWSANKGLNSAMMIYRLSKLGYNYSDRVKCKTFLFY